MRIAGFGTPPLDQSQYLPIDGPSRLPPQAQPAQQNVPGAAGNAWKSGTTPISNPTPYSLSVDNLAALLNLQEAVSTPGSAIVAPSDALSSYAPQGAAQRSSSS